MLKQNDYYFDEINKDETFDLPLFDGIQNKPVPKYLDNATEQKAEVYELLSPEAQRQKVFEIIKELKYASDNQVARRLKIHPSTVSARRNELIARGRVVPVMDEGKKVQVRDEVTNTKNVVWRVVE